MYLRLSAVILLILGSVSGIAALFWHAEYQYKTPTKIPENYRSVRTGDYVSTEYDTITNGNQSMFLHFYNPDCPCSRFNIRHLRKLVNDYNGRTEVTIVVQSTSDRELAVSEFGENIRYLVDTDHKIAKACGVYSTPQAVIIDKEGKLYYRGNYNQSRYCTSRATNYAELALLSFLNNQPPPVFDLAATQSYGCELKGENPYRFINQP